MDINNRKKAVDDALATVLRRSGQGVPISSTSSLATELGMRSLDIAEIAAILDLQLGMDPFAAGFPVPSLKTVADLYRAYDAV